MENLKYIVVYIVILLLIWVAGSLFADNISTFEVIEPEKGVKCVVVSRMFNTSVDCWKINHNQPLIHN